jgi:hypothetical protein
MGCRGRAEVEAESVAFLVCAGAGLATDAYSFPHVTVWSRGDASVVKATAGRVISAARSVLDGLGLVEREDLAAQGRRSGVRPSQAHNERTELRCSHTQGNAWLPSLEAGHTHSGDEQT